MHDPWDVTVTYRSDQYVSCMKINGVPLLPPVLSRECRKEMQYYKALAREVEKRINILRSLVEERAEARKDSCVVTHFDDSDLCKGSNEQSATSGDLKTDSEKDCTADDVKSVRTDTSDVNSSSPVLSSPTLVIGVIDSFKDNLLKGKENIVTPERDRDISSNSIIKNSKTNGIDTTDLEKEKDNISSTKKLSKSTSYSPNLPIGVNEKFDSSNNTGPQSLTNSKSVDDIRTELSAMPKLVRQSSYTILQPGPELLAHLEVQSMNSGVEMSSISMSDSFSNLPWLAKKRRSWDLESAKVKWNSMALELNGSNSTTTNRMARSKTRSQVNHPEGRVKSVVTEKPRRTSTSSCRALNTHNSFTVSAVPKSFQKPFGGSLTLSPNKKELNICKTDSSQIEDESQDEKELLTSSKENLEPPLKVRHPSNVENPTDCIRDLYEKIRDQQLTRMAKLMEKQKKEKKVLQQMFEEQNTLFYKQLKSICPVSPVESKEAWSEKASDDNGLVSLSQLINGTKQNTPVLTTAINDTRECLQKTDAIIRKGRSIRQSTIAPRMTDSSNISSVRPQVPIYNTSKPTERSGLIGSHYVKTGFISPYKITSDTSRSDMEPILTDRTDHTLADLNFTMSSDELIEFIPELSREYTFTKDNRSCADTVVIDPAPTGGSCRSRSERRGNYNSHVEASRTERSSSRYGPKNSFLSESKISRKLFADKPTVQERAAATRIVACARGYLTRRLMRTDRVQTIVQTIRDALVCALELHEDREGIRGADVDLHRRLIQQITAACYSLHDTFVASSPADRCALIAQDRERQRALEQKQLSSNGYSSSRAQATPTRRHSRRKSPMSWWDRDRQSPSASRQEGGACSPGAPVHSCVTPHPSLEFMVSKSPRMQSPEKYLVMGKDGHRKPWR